MESINTHFEGVKVLVENRLFPLKNDNLIGFSHDFWLIVIKVIMDGIPTSVQGKFRLELRLRGHLA